MIDPHLPSDDAPDSPSDEARFRRAVDAVARGPVVVMPADTDAAWQALAARLDSVSTATGGSTRAASSASRRAPWMMAAAAALVGLVSAQQWRTHRQLAMHEEVRAALGEQKIVQLPDGSRLTLAAGSSARWRRDMSDAAREVQLDGEGYFDVVHDSTRPFRVYARHGVIEDVGTRFLVRAWTEQEALEVHVTEGEVALSDSAQARRTTVQQRHAVTAGRLGILDTDGSVRLAPLDSSAVAWLSGTLAFTDTPLREALPVLSRWYAAPIDADPALLERRLTGRFTQRSLPQLLDAVALALGVRAERTASGWRLHQEPDALRR